MLLLPLSDLYTDLFDHKCSQTQFFFFKKKKNLAADMTIIELKAKANANATNLEFSARLVRCIRLQRLNMEKYISNPITQ